MALRRSTVLYGLAAAVVAVAVAVTTVVLVSRGGASSGPTVTPTRSALFVGVPQRGLELGDSSAPALYEYADLMCPYCAEFSRRVLPTVVRDYVRTGKVKLVFHGLAFVGPDSQKALRAVDSAASQNRLWDVLDALYQRQGPETQSWVTDSLLDEVGSGISGLDVKRWLDGMGSADVRQRMQTAANAANQAGIRGTPTFVLGGTQLNASPLDPADFSRALNAALQG